MGNSEDDPAVAQRPAWNAGKSVRTERPLTQKQIWAIRFFLDREERLRDRALLDLAIDSKLRGCDLVAVKIGDLVAGPEIRRRATIVQRKTGRPAQFELTTDVRKTLLTWLERRGGSRSEESPILVNLFPWNYLSQPHQVPPSCLFLANDDSGHKLDLVLNHIGRIVVTR